MSRSGFQEKPITRTEALRKVNRDWLRPMRLVEVLDTDAIFTDSPVEVKNGYVVSDRETGELFLILVFRSVSKRPIAALDIRVLFYEENRPLPFRKDDFRYSEETATLGERTLHGQGHWAKRRRREQAIVQGEEFGQGVCLPLPEDYCHRIRIELMRVIYEDGGCDVLQLLVGGRVKRFADMDSGLRASYAQVNIYERREEAHPIRVLPQEGKNVWLCCCGHKNPAAACSCEICKREKGWQMETLSEEHLCEVRRAMDEEEHRLLKAGKKRVLHDTSAYSGRRHYDSVEDQERKAEQFRRARWQLHVQSATDAARRLRRVFLALFLLGLLVGFIYLLREFVYAAYRMGFFGGWEALKKVLGKDALIRILLRR